MNDDTFYFMHGTCVLTKSMDAIIEFIHISFVIWENLLGKMRKYPEKARCLRDDRFGQDMTS